MSETAPRTIEQVNQEYQQACYNAGNLHYQIKTLQEELDAIVKHQRELNQEGYVLKQAVAAAPEKPLESTSSETIKQVYASLETK